MPFSLSRLARQLLFFFSSALLGVLLAAAIGLILLLNARDELAPWHLAELDQEFTVNSDVSNFAEYLVLEDRLFAQLDALVYDRTGPVGDDDLNRYKRSSLSDPGRWPRNWNRSYELPSQEAEAAVLLLHGLSDSPYSLRHLAQRLGDANAHVLGLRIPGHGTSPSGLVHVTWQDMAAAVTLAMRHLHAQHRDKPIHIVGYSNGAALAVHYALQTLQDQQLPAVGKLVLISPEIGVTPIAALAKWQARLGRLLGLDKLAWNSIQPEYDPFKYGSFAVNAGDLSHQITGQVQTQMDRLSAAGKLQQFPPVQAYSSVVDATVLAPALVEQLFNRLPDKGNELLLFDINVMPGIEHLLKWDPEGMINSLRDKQSRGFSLTLVTNEDQPNGAVVARHWAVNANSPRDTELNLYWPDEVFSLSHVALTFPPWDSLYGGEPNEAAPGIQLGRLALRGERNVLHVSPDAMLRMRWNPFYSYLESTALEFLNLDR